MPDSTYYKQLILNHVSHLTKNQKKIARLAQTLGYKGFLELKTEYGFDVHTDFFK